MDPVRRLLICGLLAMALAGMMACGSSNSTNTNQSTTQPSLSTLTLNPATVNGGQSSTATVTLTAPAVTGGFTVLLTSPNNSTMLPGNQTLTIPAGATSGKFRIDTIPVGSTQTAQITVTYLSVVTLQATLTIVSTNPLSVTAFTVNPSTVTSGQTLIGTITLNSPALSPGQQVVVATTDSTAVQPQNPVTVPTSMSVTSFNIFTSPITTTRTVTLTANLNTSTISVQLMVQPTGTAVTSLSVVPFTVAGGQNTTGTVSISAPAPAGGVTVQLAAGFTNTATPAGTVLPITVPMSVSILQGAVQAQFTAHTSAVTKTTGVIVTASVGSTQISFTDCLTNPLLPGCSFVTIVPSLTLAGINCVPATLTTGNTGVCSVSLSIPAPAGGQMVQLMSSNTTALPVPATVTVPAGSSNQSFTVTGGSTTGTTSVTLTASLQGATTGTVTTMVSVVSPSAITLSSLVLSTVAVQGGPGAAGTVTGTLTISADAPPGGLAISLTSSDPSAVFSNGMTTATVTVAQNATTVSFPITTTAVTSQVNVTLTAAVNSSSQTAALAVVPPPVVTSVSVSPSSVVGTGTATGTVMLQNAAPQGGAAVTLQSSSNVAQFAATVTVPAGATSATFLVTTLPVTTAQNVIITASLGSSSQQTMLTVLPPMGDLRLLFFNPATIPSGGTSTGTVVLTAPAPSGGTTVTLSSDIAGVTVPTMITVPQGASSATFTANGGTVTTLTRATITGKVTASATSNLTVLPAPSGTASEQIVLGGETNSTDFPLTSAFQGSLGAGNDTGFLTSIAQSTPAGGATASSVAFSTYLGGMSSFGQVRDVFVDSSDNVFACGVTLDQTLKTTANAAQATPGGGEDAFIAEFSKTGALLYLTYLGGAGDETCNSLSVDSSGNIYVIGSTTNSSAMGAANLMGTPGAFQTANAGGSDMFVAKINNPAATTMSGRLVWLTLVGGAGDDFADGRLAVDGAGDVFLSGTTQSMCGIPGGFPFVGSCPGMTGVKSAGVVLGISADGAHLLFTTFLFGRANGANPGTPTTTTASGGIALANGNLYVCGQTNASDLRVSANAVQVGLKGKQDSYIAVLNGAASIAALTYLGGTSATQACKGVTFDRDMQPIIVMPTDAADFPPASPGAVTTTLGPVAAGKSHFSVTKLTSDLSAIIFSTLVGGSGSESADATRLLLDNSENLYFSLATTSGDFPVTSNAIQTKFAGTPLGSNRNVAVVKLSSDGSMILYSSYLGGTTDNSTTSLFYHIN